MLYTRTTAKNPLCESATLSAASLLFDIVHHAVLHQDLIWGRTLSSGLGNQIAQEYRWSV